MRLGHGPRRTVVILWLWTALLSGLALLPTYTSPGTSTRSVPIGVLALALVLYAFFVPGRTRGTGPTREAVARVSSTRTRSRRPSSATVVDLESRRRGAEWPAGTVAADRRSRHRAGSANDAPSV